MIPTNIVQTSYSQQCNNITIMVLIHEENVVADALSRRYALLSTLDVKLLGGISSL
jgi:hypothetical protein